MVKSKRLIGSQRPGAESDFENPMRTRDSLNNFRGTCHYFLNLKQVKPCWPRGKAKEGLKNQLLNSACQVRPQDLRFDDGS